MISDAMLIYLLGMMILLIINWVGYSRMPLLCVIGIVSTAILTPDTLLEWGDYYLIVLPLILVNFTIPIMKLTNLARSSTT